MLETARERENVNVEFGRKAVGIEEGEDAVVVRFDDGGEAGGDLLLGRDVVHSTVRRLLVEPERVPTYTGITAVSGFSHHSRTRSRGNDAVRHYGSVSE
jgi:2-polyprenyl-6-methoxyphenol hydroxylase-like FAD-dependent oxidoreductase